MPSTYADLALTASRILAEYGQFISLSREAGRTYAPGTGGFTGGAPTTWTGNGATFNYNNRDIDGVQVKAGDVRLLLEAVSTEPEPGDQVTIGSVEYYAVAVEPLSPGGTAVIYNIQLRK